LLSRYERRILRVLRENKEGLTTIEVARKADISKTTAIKYLASLRAAGKIDFVRVGPSKLWRIKEERPKKRPAPASRMRRVESLLNEFTQAMELRGSVVADTNGLALSANLPIEIDPERLSGVVPQLVRACMRLAEMAKLDSLKGIIIEGSRGRIVVHSEGKVLLIAICGLETPLGTVKVEIEDFAKKINEALEKPSGA